MSIENLTDAEIAAEMDRRKAVARTAKLAELNDLERRAASLRAELGIATRTVTRIKRPAVTTEAVLAVLAGVGKQPVRWIAEHLAPPALPGDVGKALAKLVDLGAVEMVGKARGAKYGIKV